MDTLSTAKKICPLSLIRTHSVSSSGRHGICCMSAEKKCLRYWRWIESSPQTANKADISLSLHTLPRSAILTHFHTSVKPGSTLLLSRVHPIFIVPCEPVNPGSSACSAHQCLMLRAASHYRALSQCFVPLMVDRCTLSLESGVMCRPLTCSWWCITRAVLSHVG